MSFIFALTLGKFETGFVHTKFLLLAQALLMCLLLLSYFHVLYAREIRNWTVYIPNYA